QHSPLPPAAEEPASAFRSLVAGYWSLMVGLGRLELPTSRLSSARSDQLSYRPIKAGSPQTWSRRQGKAPARKREGARRLVSSGRDTQAAPLLRHQPDTLEKPAASRRLP